ncbi:MAG: hypothetical protein AAF205_10505 [Pseudomonadota bacterium]
MAKHSLYFEIFFATISLYFALISPGFPASAQIQETVEPPEIVVTARKLDETEKALDDCLARDCPPLEDIAASIAHAEEQFMIGEYRDARATLTGAISRNREYGAEYPVPMSGLYRAAGRTAEHLGLTRRLKTDLYHMRDVLKTHAPTELPARITTEIELGDGMMKMGETSLADDIFARAETMAREHGEHRMAAIATLRRVALLLYYRNDQYDTGQSANYTRQQMLMFMRARMAKARDMIDRLIANPNPGTDDQIMAARLLGLKIDMKLKRVDAADGEDMMQQIMALAKKLSPGPHPVLLTDPVIAAAEGGPAMLGKRFFNGGREARADVRYRIMLDGTVDDIEIVDYEGDEDWPRLVAKSLKTRRYVPPQSPDQFSPGNIRFERFSRTFDMQESPRVGTRILSRTGMPTVRTIDLMPSG